MQRRILGIDIGATTVKFAAVTPEGSVAHRGALPVASAGNEQFVAQLASVIARPEFSDIDQVGIGSPGPLDLEAGKIITSANMPGVKDLALVAELSALYPRKQIRLENDANAATLGEKYFGAGKNLGDFAVLTLGTGVGGGCVFNGKLQRGFRGNFFEVGHVNVAGIFADEPRRCGCGSDGCLEAYASATGIAKSYELKTGERRSAADISALAMGGDGAAIECYRTAGRALGFAMAAITQLLNVRKFVLTGGVAVAEPLLTPTLRAAYLQQTLGVFHDSFQLIFTRGDENAGILGAAALFLEAEES
ncbi:ROK family protein [Turneriella parva]|uniref:ROK family protein n=1 Tax=Turneriella parva (strain ATCC BAA-1111 / DSM 21527 / NCTC 11395 / H) TaxID=869212 RepID=I4B9A6_TURPD|nr:ROK family protein [Turneriella parva]AFM13863.1 ROK family protein [Turneriella parva DSM 21527]